MKSASASLPGGSSRKDAKKRVERIIQQVVFVFVLLTSMWVLDQLYIPNFFYLA